MQIQSDPESTLVLAVIDEFDAAAWQRENPELADTVRVVFIDEQCALAMDATALICTEAVLTPPYPLNRRLNVGSLLDSIDSHRPDAARFMRESLDAGGAA